METTEYLAFLPLLLYGIALADLFGEWKRIFDPNERYIPYMIFTIILTEVGIYNVFIYVKLVDQLAGQTYLNYLTFLIPPFLFLLTTNIFTPDKKSNTKEYFNKRMPMFFTFFSIFIACHFLYQFDETPVTLFGRIVAIILLVAIGITRKIWLIYVLAIIWFFHLLFGANMVVN